MPSRVRDAEISFDLIMDDNVSFVEGTYRLADRDWQVFIISRRDVDAAEFKDTMWKSGVTGVHIAYPRGDALNQSVVQLLLGEHLGVDYWSVVAGPDSMQLR